MPGLLPLWKNYLINFLLILVVEEEKEHVHEHEHSKEEKGDISLENLKEKMDISEVTLKQQS